MGETYICRDPGCYLCPFHLRRLQLCLRGPRAPHVFFGLSFNDFLFFPLHGRELNCNVTDVRKPKFEISFTTDKIVQKGNGTGKLYVSSPRPTGRKRHLGSGSRTRQLAVGSAIRYGSGCAPHRPRDLGQAPPCVRASNLLRWEHSREQHCILRGSFRGGIGEIQFGNSWQGIWNVFTFYK